MSPAWTRRCAVRLRRTTTPRATKSRTAATAKKAIPMMVLIAISLLELVERGESVVVLVAVGVLDNAAGVAPTCVAHWVPLTGRLAVGAFQAGRPVSGERR